MNTFGFESSHCAKVASDMNKPNGQLVVPFKEEVVVQFAQDLPIRKVRDVSQFDPVVLC